MKLVRFLPALMFAAASPAFAAEPLSAPPAASTNDPEALAAALALFDGMDLQDQLLASALHMVKAAIDTRMETLSAQGTDLPETLTEKLRAFMYEETRLMVEEMAPTYRQDAAAVYARHFTAEELRELKLLQERPVMQKMERLAPSLMAELGKIGMRVAAERSDEMERKAVELVEQWLAEETMAEAGPRT